MFNESFSDNFHEIFTRAKFREILQHCLQDKGKLVDVFNTKYSSAEQRSRALDDIIRQEIVQFLYNNGAGKVVKSKRNAFAPLTHVRFVLFSTRYIKISHSYRPY